MDHQREPKDYRKTKLCPLFDKVEDSNYFRVYAKRAMTAILHMAKTN